MKTLLTGVDDRGRVVEVNGPRALRGSLRRLRRASRAHSRKVKGSANRRKATARLARIHARVANVRADALHQATTDLAARYETVVAEDLNVTGMLANRKLARAVADQGFGTARRMLGYKTEWNGGQLKVADRWYPSSKTCPACGWRKPTLTLAERVFTCETCGLVMDRDENAARNLPGLAASGAERLNASYEAACQAFAVPAPGLCRDLGVCCGCLVGAGACRAVPMALIAASSRRRCPGVKGARSARAATPQAPLTSGSGSPGQSGGQGMGFPGLPGPGASAAGRGGVPGLRGGRGRRCQSHIRVSGSQAKVRQDGAPGCGRESPLRPQALRGSFLPRRASRHATSWTGSRPRGQEVISAQVNPASSRATAVTASGGVLPWLAR